MGGRGASGGAKKVTLNEFLGERGLSAPISDYMIDKLRIPHSQTKRQRDKMQKEAQKAAKEYSEKRQAAIKEYKSLKESGKIKEKSKIDVLLETAKGHSDNSSVQAARRALEKRGIDWKTGKKRKRGNA